ncbi:MAG: stage V sporulation protein AA [Schaedlerella sp.]|nr:stage V sporulation protein AA [Schaedlerella sp.]
MSAEKETLYIMGQRNVEVKKQEVILGDILNMECSNKTLIPKIKAIKIYKMPQNKNHRIVVSVLKIIETIHSQYPEVDVQNLGETDIIITYEQQNTKGKLFHIVKAAFVSAITFCGAAFAIMAFNNDASVTDIFSQIERFVTGQENYESLMIEIGYSIGIAIGILVFFNHFGQKKFTVDPTPLEVQMRQYENQIQEALVEDAARKGQEIDVCSAGNSGTDRS